MSVIFTCEGNVSEEVQGIHAKSCPFWSSPGLVLPYSASLVYAFDKAHVRILRHQGIFPSIVMVKCTMEDKYGRKYVMCKDDTDRDERIYTNQDIDPAKHYFLHPLTNPARIYPILVEYRPAK